MAKLPKAIIRKYGISKKAWSVFRGQRKTRKTTIRTIRRRGVSTMARRRIKRSRGSRKGVGSSITNEILGAGGVVLYESFLSPMLPLGSGLTKNAVEFGLGYYLRKKGGMLGSTGKALMTINAVEVIRGLLGGATATQTATISNF